MKIIGSILIITLLVGCKKETVTVDQLRQEVDQTTDDLQFVFLNNSPSSSAQTTLRILGINSGEQVKIYTDSNCFNKINEKKATNPKLDIALSFTAEDTYPLYYKLTDTKAQTGTCNSTKLKYTYDTSAPLAASFSLNTNSPSNLSTPKLNISGLEKDALLKIYEDNNCQTLRYSNKVTSTNLTTEIQKPFTDEGTYQFYYKLSDEAGNSLEVSSSECVNTSISYQYDKTPPSLPTSIDFDGAVNTLNKHRLKVVKDNKINAIKIYSDFNCTQLECDSTYSCNPNTQGNCIDKLNQCYSQGSNNEMQFSFEENENTVLNYYYISYDNNNNESNCLKVENNIETTRANDEQYFYSSTSSTTRNIYYNKLSDLTSIDKLYSIDVYSDKYCQNEVICSGSNCDEIYNSSTSGIYFRFYNQNQSNDARNYYFRGNDLNGKNECMQFSDALIKSNTNSEFKFRLLDLAKDKDSNFDIDFNNTQTNDLLYLFSDADCSNLMTTTTTSNTSTSVNLSLSTSAEYDLYYALRDQAGNFIKYNDSYCLSTDLTYQLDLGAPEDFTQKLMAPTFIRTNAENINIDLIDETKGVFDFENSTIGSTLYIYQGKSCNDNLIKTQSITQSTESIELNFNAIKGSYISYKEISSNGSSGTCNDFNFRPIKKDGIENQVTIKISFDSKNDYTNESDSTLKIFEAANCGGSSLSTSILEDNELKQDEQGTWYIQLDIDLPQSGDYVFSSEITDIAGNSTCIDTAENGIDTLEYKYYELLSVATGFEHTCATVGDPDNPTQGQLYCWGRNQQGQLGPITTVGKISTPMPLDNTTNALKVYSYNDSTCIIGDQSYCFGENTYGKLGTANASANSSSLDLISTASTYTDITLGLEHGCGLTTDNDIECWGDDTFDQLGDAATGEQNSPISPSVPASTTYSDINAGHKHTCAKEVGTNYFTCWGHGLSGELGNGSQTNSSTIASGQSVLFEKIASGNEFSCGLKSAGEIFCWGNNNNGVLGDAQVNGQSASLSSSAIQINSQLTFTDLDASFDNACAIDDSKDIYCWGAGFDGIKKITDKMNFNKVYVGAKHFCASLDIGTLYCWGANNYGQLGVGSYFSKNAPQKVKFDFQLTQLEFTNDNTDQIVDLVDLKTDINTNENLTFIYNNTADDYLIGNDTFINYNINIENTSLYDATIDTNFTFSEYIVDGEDVDFSNNFQVSDTDCTSTLSSGSSCYIEIQFEPTLPRPNGMSSVLSINYSDNDQSYQKEIIITGYSKKAISHLILKDKSSNEIDSTLKFNENSDPANATLIQNNLESALEQTVTLENNSNEEISISVINFTGTNSDQFEIDEDIFINPTSSDCYELNPQTNEYELTGTISVGSSCSVKVIFKPNQDNCTLSSNTCTTSTDAKLTIAMSTETESEIVSIPLEAYSIIYTPEFTMYDSENNNITTSPFIYNPFTSPLTVSLHTQTEVFTITNTGDSDDASSTFAKAINLDISISGNDPTQFEFTGSVYPGVNGTCADSLDVGQSCTVEVQYTPTSISSFDGGNDHEAQLEINVDNDQHDDPVNTLYIDIIGHFNN